MVYIARDWIIRNKNDDSFWSNSLGWSIYSAATIFTQEEHDKFNLPIEGEWKPL